MSIKSTVRFVAQESVRIAAIGVAKAAKFGAHKAIDANCWVVTKTNRALRPVTRGYVELVTNLLGQDLPRQSVDAVMDIAEETVIDMHGIVHGLVDGEPLIRTCDRLVQRYSDYMHDAVPVFMDAKAAA